MDDILSVDSFNGNNDDKKNIFDMEWSEEHEKILVDWADKAMCYRWLHAQANIKFSKLSKWFTIPVIIISTLTGTANFAQDRVPVQYVEYFVMAVGALNIVAGIISTIGQFLKINELNESHRVSSIAWDKFYRNIKIELAKNPKERVPVGQMIKLSKEEFDRLMETSPVIQADIIDKFSKTFKGKDSFLKINKPEICDELVSTELFRFIPKEVVDNTLASKMKAAAKKALQLKRRITAVKEFYEKFEEAQSRKPTMEEVMESITENNHFEGMSPEEIEKVVENFLTNSEENIQNNVKLS